MNLYMRKDGGRGGVGGGQICIGGHSKNPPATGPKMGTTNTIGIPKLTSEALI